MKNLQVLKPAVKQLKNEKGYSLASLVAGLPLAVLVFTIVTLALVNFLTTYQETRLFNQLQDDLFQAVETMKYGYAVKNINQDYGLIGMMTAQKVEIANTKDRVKLTPVIINPGQPFYSTFYLDNKGVIRCSGNYAFQAFHGIDHPIFPESSKKIGHNRQFKVDDLTFSVVQSNNGAPALVKINVEATVRFREKRDGESMEEDIKKNTRTIEYETLVHIANASLG